MNNALSSSKTSNLALLFGAGFSCWAAQLPIARQLFDFAIEPWGIKEEKKFELIKFLKGDWDAMHPEGQLEQFIADAMNFPTKGKEAMLWYIKQRLCEGFIWKELYAHRMHRHVLMIDENRRFQIEGVVKVRDFIQHFRHMMLSGIVTTNYDMLIEYALGTKGFNYGIKDQILIGRGPYPLSQWRNPVKLSGLIPLAKIHGSISWDESGYYTDGRRGLTGNALIIAPTLEKKAPDALKNAWILAKNIFSNAKRIIVFGFAFNPYDEAVLDLLRISGAHIKCILLIDIDPPIERAHAVWPNAQIATALPPSAGTDRILAWLRK